MLDKLITFLRDEAVLCIAFVCACVSIVLVGDVTSAASYIDYRVIILLFCLMAAVAGLRSSGVLARIAQGIVAGERDKRLVCLALVMLPFFASMLVTNDVALLTFVPIAVLALETAGWRDDLVRVIVLQAIAANLGGMITPVGNPQNLFIFTTYDLSLGDFFCALAPFGGLALASLAIACISFGKERSNVILKLDDSAINVRLFVLHTALFLLSVVAVLRVVPYQVALLVVVGALFVFDRKVFLEVDYALLVTFACFFIFSGNLADMPTMQSVLGSFMHEHPMFTSLVTSQIISNVPAAVLLAGFTHNWHSLLIGVDLGGLGTPIASLASLIAFKMYMHTRGARALAFMKDFAIANTIALALMAGLYGVFLLFK